MKLKMTERHHANEYVNNAKKYIATTRFNSETLIENKTYRESNSKIKCIYPSPELIAPSVPVASILFILEMNNDTNQITGIGIIKNRMIQNKYHVYKDNNYNRYGYIGTMRIDRAEMSAEEERIMKVFDILCFKGARHLKRLRGIKTFSSEMLYRCSKIVDLIQFISNMFKNRMT